MQNVKVDEAQTKIKIARRSINNFRYADESIPRQVDKKSRGPQGEKGL